MAEKPGENPSTVNVATLNIEVRVFPFLSNTPATRQPWLTADEIEAFKGMVVLPKDFYSNINTSDGIESSSFTITLPGAADKSFIDDQGRKVRVDELLDVGNIIEIVDRNLSEPGNLSFNQVFVGYITGHADNKNAASGQSDLVVSGGGIEEAIRQQSLFIDTGRSQSDSSNTTTPKAGAVRTSSRFASALSFFVNNIKNFKNTNQMITQLASVPVNEVLDIGQYGGLKFSQLFDPSTALGLDVYTNGFLHVISWPKTVQFGQSINFWNLIETFATPPLYELFATNDIKLYHLDASSSAQRKLPSGKTQFNLGRPITDSPGILSRLIYRKTPFQFLDDPPLSDPSLVYRMSADKIKDVQYDVRIEDIFSGVHVGLGILGNNAISTIVNPPTYSPALLEKFGQKVLSITLDGIGFPEKNEKHNSTFQSRLASIQEQIFSVFGEGNKNVSATFDIHYLTRNFTDKDGNKQFGISKGKILVVDPVEGDQLPHGLHRYGRTWYIESISTEYDMEAGEITQSVTTKWGQKRRRSATTSTADPNVTFSRIVT